MQLKEALIHSKGEALTLSSAVLSALTIGLTWCSCRALIHSPIRRNLAAIKPFPSHIKEAPMHSQRG